MPSPMLPTKLVLPKHQDQVSFCFNQRLHASFCQTSSCVQPAAELQYQFSSKQYALLIHTPKGRAMEAFN